MYPTQLPGLVACCWPPDPPPPSRSFGLYLGIFSYAFGLVVLLLLPSSPGCCPGLPSPPRSWPWSWLRQSSACFFPSFFFFLPPFPPAPARCLRGADEDGPPPSDSDEELLESDDDDSSLDSSTPFGLW